ncbi:MAG TPA: hypothetical protein VEW71_07555 [Allosphingosinicella sp.]|nr:hypothetical protein [Allosphingosinicella sp.]
MADTRARRAIFPVSLLLLLFLFVYACVPKPITDLRPAEVARVPASALPPTDDLRDTLTRRGEALWKVSLEGDANWIREVRRHELNSYATVVRCDDRDYGVLSLGPYVGLVPVTNYGDGFRDYQPASSIVRYDVYLPETGRYHSEADFNAQMPSYDFGSQRTALCIRIAGGAMHGAYNRSNEVRVEVGGQR